MGRSSLASGDGGIPSAQPDLGSGAAGLRRARLGADGRGRGTCDGGAAAESVDVDYPLKLSMESLITFSNCSQANEDKTHGVRFSSFDANIPANVIRATMWAKGIVVLKPQ
jgi:hypothetical protein